MNTLLKQEKNFNLICHSCVSENPAECKSLLNIMPLDSRVKPENDREVGRSMVEMLGVLAVMGVLSVGGVAMYTNAMNKHKANEILNEASKRAVMVAMQAAAGQDLNLGEFSGQPNASQFSVAENPSNNQQFQITISSVDDEICRQIVNSVGAGSQIRKITSGGTDVTNKANQCSDSDVVMTFNKDLSHNIFASDFATQADCQAPFSWCEELGKCQNAGDSCACPDENSSTSGTGDAITGTNCKCNSGYQLNVTGTGCESALPYCAIEGNCVFYEGRYTYNQAVQKCAENDKTLVMAVDLGCEEAYPNADGGTCPNIPEEFKLNGVRLGDSSIFSSDHLCLLYGDAFDFYSCSDDLEYRILCK